MKKGDQVLTPSLITGTVTHTYQAKHAKEPTLMVEVEFKWQSTGRLASNVYAEKELILLKEAEEAQ